MPLPRSDPAKPAFVFLQGAPSESELQVVRDPDARDDLFLDDPDLQDGP